MSVVLEKGSEAKFIELDQNDVVRRFVVPDINGLEGRVQSLIKRYPGLSLVRIGRAIVASEDGASDLKDSLQGVPSTVDTCFMVDLCGDHPVLGQGPARYSAQLIQEISAAQVEAVQQEETEQGQTSIYDFAEKVEEETPAMALPTPPKLSLTEQLLKQKEAQETETKPAISLEAALAAKKSETPAAKSEIVIVKSEEEGNVIQAEGLRPTQETTPIKQDNSKRFPHLDKQPNEVDKALESYPASKMSTTQRQLNDALERARKEREEKSSSPSSQIRIMEPRPLGKIDVLLEKVERIESILTDGLYPEDGEAVTGQELQAWFWEHVDTIGHEKTFAILASRLKEA
jgi:hypothetical protein